MNIQINNPFNIRFFQLQISLSEIINVLFPIIFLLASIIAIAFLIWGAMLMISARGDNESLEKGIMTIRNSITGLFIIFIVIGISSWLGNYLGFDFLNFQNLIDFLDNVNYIITDWRLKL